MQKIQIIGNLAKDAALVDSQTPGKQFISMIVIVNEKKGDVETKTSYEVTFRSTGVFPFLKSGKKVFVEGTPSSRAYINKEGKAVSQLKIFAENVELL